MPIFMRKNGIIRLNRLYCSLKKIEAYDAETYILSHHDQPRTRLEMEAELKLMKECARVVVEHRGNRALMEQELAKELKRDLTEDELETIGFFREWVC
ncbi:hypothetical protein RCO48_23590 [Peribacillus frigoritolerans]|nr:hypothetical protein [Peribacillus frigoritolerans]